jgi:hypothetical protein
MMLQPSFTYTHKSRFASMARAELGVLTRFPFPSFARASQKDVHCNR